MTCLLLYVYDIFSYCCFKIIEVVWADLKVCEDHGKSVQQNVKLCLHFHFYNNRIFFCSFLSEGSNFSTVI
jgi:hypothetical protein